jgi:hypothetical protein
MRSKRNGGGAPGPAGIPSGLPSGGGPKKWGAWEAGPPNMRGGGVKAGGAVVSSPSSAAQACDVDVDRERFRARQHVTAKHTGSTAFSAIVHTVSPAAGGAASAYVFQANRRAKAVEASVFSGDTEILLAGAEVAQIVVESIVLEESQPGMGGGGSSSFRTDTDISASSAAHLMGRPLEPVRSRRGR